MDALDFVKASAGLQTFALDAPEVHVITVTSGSGKNIRSEKVVLLHEQGRMKETMAKYLDFNNYCYNNAECRIDGAPVFTLRRIASHWQ
jgi:hypothetical protein